MTRSLRTLALALALGSAACGLELGATYPGDYYGDYPPDAYIATTAPVYFDGRPTYWYGGHWYYRDGGRWAHYSREPPALYQRRIAAPPARHVYESGWRGRPVGRAGGRGGHR